MTGVNYNLGVLPNSIPEQDTLAAANRLNQHRFQNLTNKQRVFVDAYLSYDFDEVRAAKEAGFQESDCKKMGRRMLKRPEIQQAIQYALEYYSEATKLRFERLVEELKIIALTSITDLVDPETVELRSDLDESDIRFRAIKKIKRTETRYGTNVEFEMYDRMAAIDKLMKILEPERMRESEPQPTTVTTNVAISIVPVPTGQFLPPPPSPYTGQAEGGLVIEGSATPAPTGVTIDPRAAVPLEVNG